MKMVVVVMRGVSGSGKSTYIKNNYPGAIVCSADDYFVQNGSYQFDAAKLPQAHGACLRKFVDVLAVNANNVLHPTVVVDNTNCGVDEVAPYAALASAYGYELRVVTLLVDPSVAHSRNVHGVKLETVQNQYKRLYAGTRAMPDRWISNHKIVVNDSEEHTLINKAS
jgi:predicted kinase